MKASTRTTGFICLVSFICDLSLVIIVGKVAQKKTKKMLWTSFLKNTDPDQIVRIRLQNKYGSDPDQIKKTSDPDFKISKNIECKHC